MIEIFAKMFSKFSRRIFFIQIIVLMLAGCQSTSSPQGTLTVGVINYGGGQEILEQYAKFNRYLGEKTKARIVLEPTYNENKAIERLNAKAWSLVVAPPGLAAIAISRYQYTPVVPLFGINNLRSVLVVRQDNPIQELQQLQGQTVALGQLGSATGYYLPLYNLYGLTLAEILFAPTPETVLQWVADGKATAGAVSLEEFKLYSPKFGNTEFRIIHTDPHSVPPGVILIGPNIERNRQEYISTVIREFPANLAQEIGYVPNGQLPDYQYMISVVKRVQSITSDLNTQPVNLF
jgi:phosphonate transport system substrate-binding protein